jgi:succinate-acetate transporter protein
VLFILLAMADGMGSPTLSRVAGWEGLFCGFSAIYAAFAQILNEVYGRVIMPLGEKAL